MSSEGDQEDGNSSISEGEEALVRACLLHASSHPSSYSPGEMVRLLASLSSIEESHGILLAGARAQGGSRRGHVSPISASSSFMPGRMIHLLLSRVSDDILTSSLTKIDDLDLALSSFRALRFCDDLALDRAARLALDALASSPSPSPPSSSSFSSSIIDVSSLVSFLHSFVLLSNKGRDLTHPLLSSAASHLLPNLDVLTLDELINISWTYSASLMSTHGPSNEMHTQDILIDLLGGITLMMRAALPPPSLLDPLLDLTKRELKMLGQGHAASVIWAESRSLLNPSPCPLPLRIRREIVSAWIELQRSTVETGRQHRGQVKVTNEVLSVAGGLGWVISSSSLAVKEGMDMTGALMEALTADLRLILLEGTEAGGSGGMAIRALLLSDPTSFISNGVEERLGLDHRLVLDLIQEATGCRCMAVSVNLAKWAAASKNQKEEMLVSLLS